jgi:hypothetical protein
MLLLLMFMLLMVVELFEFWAEALSINNPPNRVTTIRARTKESFLMLVNSFANQVLLRNLPPNVFPTVC